MTLELSVIASALAQSEPGRKSFSNSLRVVVAIPAYNEERFVGSVVLQARRIMAEVVVIDDGSSDATAYIAEAAGATVLRHTCNQGKGQAVNTVLEWARQNKVDALVLIDGDGQHRPDEIQQVLAPILAGKADITVGSRFLSVKSKIPAYRRVGQQALTMATNVASSVPITDSQSGFRALSRKAIEALHFDGTGFSVESEMQFLVKQHDLSITEVPISVIYQEKAKRNPVAHGLQIISTMTKLVGQHRPLLFFGIPGFIALIFGIVMGNLTVSIYSETRQLATGYALIAVLSLIVGLLSVFVGLILHSVRAFFLDLKKLVQLRRNEPAGFSFASDKVKARSGAGD